MKNILYVHSGDNWIAGSEKVFLSLFEQIDRRRFTPYLICDQPLMQAEAEKRGVPAIMMKFHYFLQDYHYKEINPIPFIRDIGKIARLAKGWNIDLIHATNGGPSQLCYFAAKKVGIPWVCHVQTLFLKRSRVMGMISLADRIICISDAVAKDYRNSKNLDRVQVLYNGIFEPSLPKVSKKSIKRELGFEESDLVIGTVAFLIPRKRVDIFIDMAEKLRSLPKLKFLIVGHGPLEKELKERVTQLKLEDRIKFVGHSDQVLRLMRGIDIFSLFSEKEPFGLVVLEALSQEVPVVASNIDGIREVVREGVDGYLVDPTDLYQIQSRVLELVKSATLRKKMGVLGRQHVQEDFSYQAFLKGIEQIYEEVIV